MIDEYKLDDALYSMPCGECEDPIEWEFSADPDTPRWFGSCGCRIVHVLRVTKVVYSTEPEEE